MKKLRRLYLFILIALCSLTSSVSLAQSRCLFPKNSQLARDQRDSDKMNCLRSQIQRLSFANCTQVARSMEYSTTAEEAKLLCLYEKATSLSQCLNVAKSLEYPDSGDEARWHCLKNFSGKLSKAECKKISEKMSYPAQRNRATVFCQSEI